MVLHMKELIYTAIFVGLGILLVILLVCMFNKKDDGEKSKETMKYQTCMIRILLTLQSRLIS